MSFHTASGCSTYTPFGSLAMRGRWTARLRWWAARETSRFALFPLDMEQPRPLRHVGPASQPTGFTSLARVRALRVGSLRVVSFPKSSWVSIKNEVLFLSTSSRTGTTRANANRAGADGSADHRIWFWIMPPRKSTTISLKLWVEIDSARSKRWWKYQSQGVGTGGVPHHF